MNQEHRLAIEIMSECGMSPHEIVANEDWRDGERPGIRLVEEALDISKRRQKGNHFVTYKGHTRTMSEWSRITGIPRQTLALRIASKWPLEQAFTQKSGTQGKKKGAA